MKILVSACLLGSPVRYDGRDKALDHAGLERLLAEDRVIAFCPEVAGGLPVPRPAAEIKRGDGVAVIDGRARVETREGTDVTDFFVRGAQQALAACRQHDIRVAILTESSPSCGSSRIYDGSFKRVSIDGGGVTAALLEKNGIAVYSQHRLDEAIEHLDQYS